MDGIEFEVVQPGNVIVDVVHLHSQGLAVAAVEIDFASKHPVLLQDDGNQLTIGKSHLYEPIGARSIEATTITIPDFEGWQVFACDSTRYTLRICFWIPS